MRSSTDSTLKLLASLPLRQRQRLLEETARKANVTVEQLKEFLRGDWRITGRPKQQEPDGDWTYWFLKAGRGFGKTISVAQWAKRKALAEPVRFALVAPTIADVRDTMVEGETGLLSVLPAEALRGQSRDHAWNRSLNELYLANGTKFKGFSSVEPDRIRGPQHHYAWCEEVSSWKDAAKGDALDTTWSNVKLSTRLGTNPQFAITSTPKPNKLTKQILALDPSVLRVVTGSSYENRDNLSEAWWQLVIGPYEGTRLGRQEIHAELLEDVEGALWSAALLERQRIARAPSDLGRIGVGVDPNASSSEAANNAGIVVAGRSNSTGYGFVLADRTVDRGGPAVWAQAAVDAYHEFDADWVVAEANNGGEMVKLVIQAVDPDVPVELVHASRGKRTRAEPIAALYEGSTAVKPSVFHAGPAVEFAELEEEMRSWTPEMDSPDRMDALVWVLTKLMLKRQGRVYSGSAPKGRLPGVFESGIR
jgi:phage terminase large subunit-like protein